MPVIETLGAASARNLGFTGSSSSPVYIEDVFSTWLYTGNGSTQTINNGINLAPGATTSGWFSLVDLGGQTTGYGNAVDASGNVYISTDNSMQVLKYNSSGQLIWQRGLSVGGSNVTRIALDSSANVYVTASNNPAGWRIIKYDTNGTLLWQRVYTSSLSFDIAYSIATDSTGAVYVCGTTDQGNQPSITLIKYDTDGVLQWQRRLRNFTTLGYGVAVDSGNNPLVCGYSNGLAVVAKYNSSGTLQWQRTINSGTFNAVSFDTSSNVYVAGNNDVAAFIAKYNTSGVIQWQRSLTNPSSIGASFNSIAVNSSGDSFVCGQTTNNLGSGILLARYDTNGTLQWQRSILSATSVYTYGTSWSIKVDSSSNIYFSGGFQDQLFAVRVFFGKIPADGTGIGTYILGSGSFSYNQSSFTPATSTNTDAAGTLTDSTPSFTSSTTSLTNSTSSLTPYLATLNQVSSTGMVWMKSRSAATDHAIYDTARGATFDIVSNSTAAQTTQSTGLTAFLSNGFSIGSLAKINTSAATYASWTFRKQPKFFDVVTYTGTGSARTIAHNLGSVPGCIIVKGTSAGTAGFNWRVYHRSLTSAAFTLQLNQPNIQSSQPSIWNSTAPSSTVFSVGTDGSVNSSGETYVAYLFAHDAGGFGNAGADNVISCGLYAADTNGVTVTLGWEPQWVLIKSAGGGTPVASSWRVVDNMRGMPMSGAAQTVAPDGSSAEGVAGASSIQLLSTGFRIAGTDSAFNSHDPIGGSGATYIYIAIRRGPMKTPTSGTSVFGINASTGTGVNATVTGGQTDDAVLIKNRGAVVGSLFSSRLTGTGYLDTSTTAAEVAAGTTILQANPWDVMDGVKVGTTSTITNSSANTFINYLFRRAPGFFDVVCYTATGIARTINHNLGVAPELMIVKNRSAARLWAAYSASLLNTEFLDLASTAAKSNVSGSTYWNSTNPTASVFSVGTNVAVNDGISSNYVAYLFATVAGVSKVGSYTGTGATQDINCGFTAGARFVLIKRTDSTGDWYVWDSARGIVAIQNEAVFSTPGTYTWTVPAGVTSVSVVCVGGGGGGGGSGGGAAVTAGGTSFFNNTSTVAAGGGGAGTNTNGAGSVGGAGGTVLAGTGTNGASGPARVTVYQAVGGGGAGTLSGLAATNGAESSWGGGGGGGAYLYGTSSNAGGAESETGEAKGGLGGGHGGGAGGGRDGTGGGGGAIAYINNVSVTAGQTYTVQVGAGGLGQNSGNPTQRGGGNGGSGAVRIVWSGSSRQFPSTSITATGGLDPFLLLNSTSAENTSTTYIEPSATGFTISGLAPAALNATGGTYIFLAIA
jgi:hypothetical protein